MDNKPHFDRLSIYDRGTWTRYLPQEGTLFCAGEEDESAPAKREHRGECTRCFLNQPHTQALCDKERQDQSIQQAKRARAAIAKAEGRD